jgi:hypothetical protein
MRKPRRPGICPGPGPGVSSIVGFACCRLASQYELVGFCGFWAVFGLAGSLVRFSLAGGYTPYPRPVLIAPRPFYWLGCE